MSLRPRGHEPASPRRRWALLAVAAGLTLVVLVIDLARPQWTEPARTLAARAVAPAQIWLNELTQTELTEIAAERDALAARVSELEADLAQIDEVVAIQALAARAPTDDHSGAPAGAPSWGQASLLPARVVGWPSASAPVGQRRVIIDAGSQHGVELDQTVVDADGLVGRVTRVEPRSSEVTVLGDPGVVVGVRFGEYQALGSIAAAPVLQIPIEPRAPGELTLTALGGTPVQVGDEVLTLGSPSGLPYAAGIPLGVVVAVDPPIGTFAGTAVVRPHIEADRLNVVAVLQFPDPVEEP